MFSLLGKSKIYTKKIVYFATQFQFFNNPSFLEPWYGPLLNPLMIKSMMLGLLVYYSIQFSYLLTNFLFNYFLLKMF